MNPDTRLIFPLGGNTFGRNAGGSNVRRAFYLVGPPHRGVNRSPTSLNNLEWIFQ